METSTTETAAQPPPPSQDASEAASATATNPAGVFPDLLRALRALEGNPAATVPNPAALLSAVLTRLAALEEEVARLRAENAEMRRLQAENARLRSMLFGPRSEKMPSMRSEVRRRLEEEDLAAADPPAEESTETVEEKIARDKERRRKLGRKQSEPERERKRGLRKNLPVVVEQVLVPAASLPEGMTREDFVAVGRGEVVTRIDHVREHLVRVEYHTETLQSKSDPGVMVSAKAPPTPVEGGHYGAGVYADVVTKRCMDVTPLHRISRAYQRCGFDVAPSVLCDLFHRTASLLDPIYARLAEVARSQPYLHADETPQPVLDEGKTRRGWMWAALGSTVVLYMFSAARDAASAMRLIGESVGILMADGYSSYNTVCHEGARTRVACWAHARRLWFFARELPEAKWMLERIVDLYRIEYTAVARNLDKEGLRLLRTTESRKILDRIHIWLTEQKPLHEPDGLVDKAIKYMDNRWTELCRFVDDPNIPLDNNRAERGLRIIALGRKNSLFVGSDDGGESLAKLQTIVATCRLHEVNPYEYIRDVLIRIQTHPSKRLDELLPWNWPKLIAAESGTDPASAVPAADDPPPEPDPTASG